MSYLSTECSFFITEKKREVGPMDTARGAGGLAWNRLLIILIGIGKGTSSIDKSFSSVVIECSTDMKHGGRLFYSYSSECECKWCTPESLMCRVTLEELASCSAVLEPVNLRCPPLRCPPEAYIAM